MGEAQPAPCTPSHPTAKPPAHSARNPGHRSLRPRPASRSDPGPQTALGPVDADPVPTAALPSPKLRSYSDSETRHLPDRYHTVPHSFPDYGSVKGAVRMPRPGDVLRNVAGGHQHINTLGNNPRATTKREPSQLPKADTPAAKRPRSGYSESRFAVLPLVEDIQDTESPTSPGQIGSRRGSTTGSRAHIAVLDNNHPPNRSNRRSRGPRISENQEHTPIRPGQLPSISPRHDDIHDMDELSPGPGQYTGKATSGTRNSTIPPWRDGADGEFLPIKVRPKSPKQDANREQKKSRPVITSEDELAEQNPVKSKYPSRISARSEKRSLNGPSRRPDILPTKFDERKTSASFGPIRVKQAACHQGYLYSDPEAELGTNEARADEPCYLVSTPDCELRVFKTDESPAQPFEWLRITGMTQTLSWNPQSDIVKVTQRSNITANIGALLAIQFFSCHDAAQVATWAGENTAVLVSVKLTDELDKMFRTVVKDVINHRATRAQLQTSPSVNGVAASRPRGSLNSQQARPGSTPSNGSALTQAAGPRRPPFRAHMRVSARDIGSDVVEIDKAERPATRALRGRQAAPAPIVVEDPEPVASRWSFENQDWKKEWKMPLVFHRTTVEMDDIPRLDEGQCLNDNIINFGLHFLFEKLVSRAPGLNERAYLFNTFFHEKLRSDKSYKGKINYDGVKGWTSKVDLLSYDYIVVPVNEHYHWWVAIICNPGKLARNQEEPPEHEAAQLPTAMEPSSDVEMTNGDDSRPQVSPGEAATPEISQLSIDRQQEPNGTKQNPHPSSDDNDVVVVEDAIEDQDAISSAKRAKKRGRKSFGPPPRTYDPSEPRIITLDSLGMTHPTSIMALKHYLAAEFEHKRGIVLDELPRQLGMKAAGIPEQQNFHDCGVYLLGYMQEFVMDPDKFTSALLRKETINWDFDPFKLRRLWRESILCEHRAYQQDRMSIEAPAKRSPAGQERKTAERPASPANGQRSRPGTSHSEVISPTTSQTMVPEQHGGAAAASPEKLVDEHAGREPPAAAVEAPLAVKETPIHDSPITETPSAHQPPRQPSPQAPVPRQENGSSDEVALLPTIESIEDEHQAAQKSEEDIQFIGKLPSLTPPRKRVTEPEPERVTTKPFDKSRIPFGNFLSIPRPWTWKKKEPSPSREEVHGSPRHPAAAIAPARQDRIEGPRTSPYFPKSNLPVVEAATLVRSSPRDKTSARGRTPIPVDTQDAIDLTGEEDGVI
ncbi:hypothetical protein QBC47DRAFT_368526 [Echria macrotheca]|uniref:Ubiquitin-like protease family profile domain-containing protein n=1 Tax=Echria macrotheca TaxID=438768 RepID=A0AAJ0FA37_9PEZI|nr:hypothetical protein QBC47DRAFT_368526 [Echria macrotheca]